MRASSWVVVAAAMVSLAACSTSVVDGHPVLNSSPQHSSAPGDAQLTDPARVQRIEAAARTDLAAANSYDYRALGADLSRGLAHTTGGFHARYRHAFTTVVEPEARKLMVSQRIGIELLGLQAMPSTTRARVLVALQTRITEKASEPRVDPATALATLDLVDGHWLISALQVGGGGGPLGTIGNAGLAAAGQAADVGITDITTYDRAHYAADYARAFAATTGALRKDEVSRRASTQATIEKLHADLTGVVTGVAVVSVRGDTARFIVRSDTDKSSAPGAPIASTLEVTVQRVGTRWLLSAVQNIGVR